MNQASLRMIQGLIFSMVISHIIGCLWFLTAKLNDFNPDTWVATVNATDWNTFDLYLISLYWSVQTVLTVGYGDVPPHTVPEIILAMIWMIGGVTLYSFNIGNYGSMIEEKVGK